MTTANRKAPVVTHEKIVPKKERINRSTCLPFPPPDPALTRINARSLLLLIQARPPGQNIPRANVSRKTPLVIAPDTVRLALPRLPPYLLVTMTPENILPTYERQAKGFDRNRSKALFERVWLDRLLAHAPQSTGKRRVLDLGCGAGRPIAQYLVDRRVEVTGVDGAAAMVALFQENLPNVRVFHEDMRGLDLQETFDAVIAWDSFFHLSKDDQRAMFKTFAHHLAPRGVLLFTSGPEDSEVIGNVEGEDIYHASLGPDEYRALMAEQGIEVLRYVPEDPECDFHTVWMARLAG